MMARVVVPIEATEAAHARETRDHAKENDGIIWNYTIYLHEVHHRAGMPVLRGVRPGVSERKAGRRWRRPSRKGFRSSSGRIRR